MGIFKKKLDKTKPIYSMLPPWVKYPIIPAKSIGWRLGGEPERYLYEFRDWWSTLNAEQKDTYREIYPAPESWREFCRKFELSFFYDN